MKHQYQGFTNPLCWIAIELPSLYGQIYGTTEQGPGAKFLSISRTKVAGTTATVLICRQHASSSRDISFSLSLSFFLSFFLSLHICMCKYITGYLYAYVYIHTYVNMPPIICVFVVFCSNCLLSGPPAEGPGERQGEGEGWGGEVGGGGKLWRGCK